MAASHWGGILTVLGIALITLFRVQEMLTGQQDSAFLNRRCDHSLAERERVLFLEKSQVILVESGKRRVLLSPGMRLGKLGIPNYDRPQLGANGNLVYALAQTSDTSWTLLSVNPTTGGVESMADSVLDYWVIHDGVWKGHLIAQFREMRQLGVARPLWLLDGGGRRIRKLSEFEFSRGIDEDHTFKILTAFWKANCSV
jgi:hypothetical protein